MGYAADRITDRNRSVKRVLLPVLADIQLYRVLALKWTKCLKK